MAIAPPETDLTAPTTPPNDDPYRYGWRYVRRDLPAGEEFEQVPLTLEDVLYPEVGDFVVHSKAHEDRCIYFANVFNARLPNDPTAVVLHDVRIAWDVPELRPDGPDIAVIFGVREQRNWSTFDVAEEGVRPALIIEVTSPETRKLDLLDKLDIYAVAGVPQYVIVDTRQWKGSETLHLLGYQLSPTGYEVQAPDERGWLWMESVGLWIGLHDNQVECYDAAGNLIDDYAAVDEARAQAEARASAEAAARAQAEARASAEAAARAQAEARLHELEAALRQLRGEG
ncbi:MAG TPA: Uma2 family endonuclease [Roseiflexaceae bacterium]